MCQLRCDARLFHEALDESRVVLEILAYALERNPPSADGVERQQHFAHASFGNAFDDLIVAERELHLLRVWRSKNGGSRGDICRYGMVDRVADLRAAEGTKSHLFIHGEVFMAQVAVEFHDRVSFPSFFS